MFVFEQYTSGKVHKKIDNAGCLWEGKLSGCSGVREVLADEFFVFFKFLITLCVSYFLK